MSAVVPAIWRSIGLGFSVRSLPQATTPELAPFGRLLHLKQPNLHGLPLHLHSYAGPFQLACFSTTSKCSRPSAVQVSPKKVPVHARDSTKLSSLSDKELRQVFRQPLTREEGNKILEELQRQRVQGTLDEGLAGVSDATLKEGLTWLRKTIPLDEDAAIIARFDREEAEEANSYIAQGVKWGIYAKTADTDSPNEQPQGLPTPRVYAPQQDPVRNAKYGRSFLEERMKAKRERKELEEKEKKEAEEREYAENVRLGLPATVEEKAIARREERKRLSEEAIERTRSVYGTEPGVWPVMSRWERLWPSTFFTLAVLGFSALLATFYTPPPPTGRLRPDTPEAKATLIGVIGIQVVILSLWRVVAAQRFLYQYFVSVPGYPRPWALLANTFSHQYPLHLIANMIFLWIVGNYVHEEIGRGGFLATYISCGTVASLVSLYGHVYKAAFATGVTGASGVVAGLMGTWLVLNQDKKATIFFLPEGFEIYMGNLIILAALIGVDIYLFRKGSLLQPFMGVDYLSHFGGYAAGIGCGSIIRWKRRQHAEKDGKEETIKIGQ